MKTLTREDKVKEFRDAAGKTVFSTSFPEDKSILTGIIEELEEFEEAIEDYKEALSGYLYGLSVEQARANLCKEWADLAYVVSQAALYYDIPADESFNRVHVSNMTKVVEGKVLFRKDGKILKPDTYQAPNMKGL